MTAVEKQSSSSFADIVDTDIEISAAARVALGKRERGNEAFRVGDLELAVAQYSSAITHCAGRVVAELQRLRHRALAVQGWRTVISGWLPRPN